MKQVLFIIGFILSVFLFSPAEPLTDDLSQIVGAKESYVKQKNDLADMQHRFEMISKDMRNSNFLTPRRHVQTTFHIPNIRVIKTAVRILQDFRLKGADQSQRILENRSICQTINYSSLLCRRGYYVYTLRKIVI